MPERDLEKFFAPVKNVRLSTRERAFLWRAIESRMRGIPVRVPRTRAIGTFFSARYFAPALASLVLFAMGGISFAAEGALPGDFLYPVKISWNEEARAILSFSEAERAGWEVRRLERRLEEIELLSQRGPLDAEAQTTLEAKLDFHADNVELKIGALEERGKIAVAAAVSSELETSLATHERILNQLFSASVPPVSRAAAAAQQPMGESVADGADAGSGLDMFLKKVERRRNAAAKARAFIELQATKSVTDAKRAAELRREAAKDALEDAEDFIAKARARFGADATASAEAEFRKAAAAFVAGEMKFKAGTYAESLVSFQEAYRVARETRLFIDVQDLLDVPFHLPYFLPDGEESDRGREDGKPSGRYDPAHGKERIEIHDAGVSLFRKR